MTWDLNILNFDLNHDKLEGVYSYKPQDVNAILIYPDLPTLKSD